MAGENVVINKDYINHLKIIPPDVLNNLIQKQRGGSNKHLFKNPKWVSIDGTNMVGLCYENDNRKYITEVYNNPNIELTKKPEDNILGIEDAHAFGGKHDDKKRKKRGRPKLYNKKDENNIISNGEFISKS